MVLVFGMAMTLMIGALRTAYSVTGGGSRMPEC